MDSKLNSIVMTSILAFALIAGIPTAFENVFAQGEGGNATQGQGGMTGDAGNATSAGNATGLTGDLSTGTTQSQGDDDKDDDDDDGDGDDKDDDDGGS
jgi:hypothetical protein